jgi:hypothetical protein
MLAVGWGLKSWSEIKLLPPPPNIRKSSSCPKSLRAESGAEEWRRNRQRNGIPALPREPHIEHLVTEAAKGLSSVGDSLDGVKGRVFLFLNRAYEAGLSPDEVCNLFGEAEDSVLNRAKLPPQLEEAAIEAYGVLDAVLEQQFFGSLRRPQV